MNTKEKMLWLLEENQGTFISGEEIAGKLGVSRAAVWKAVNALRADGYQIDAGTHRGYQLSADSDILSAQGISGYLERPQAFHIEVLQSTDSTNARVREKAEQGEAEGLVIASNQQTEGRGRLGRSFYSPENSGLYFSLLLRPDGWTSEKSLSVTTMAAVAVCEAVEAVFHRRPAIKWVNDIFLDGRKVCGILTEGAFDLESGSLRYAVLGIGINVYAPRNGFPGQLQEIAGALTDRHEKDLRNRLAAEILNRFLKYYKTDLPYQDRYRDYSLVIGKDILVISPQGERPARVLDIDDRCRLIVRYPDGTEDMLASGEISIRMQQIKAN